MGVEFLAKKKAQFEHRRDAAREEELKSGNIFSSLPEETSFVYRCRATGDELPTVGERLVVIGSEGEELGVLRSNRLIGTVMPRDAAELLPLFRLSSYKMLTAVVVRVNAGSKKFSISVDSTPS